MWGEQEQLSPPSCPQGAPGCCSSSFWSFWRSPKERQSSLVELLTLGKNLLAKCLSSLRVTRGFQDLIAAENNPRSVPAAWTGPCQAGISPQGWDSSCCRWKMPKRADRGASSGVGPWQPPGSSGCKSILIPSSFPPPEPRGSACPVWFRCCWRQGWAGFLLQGQTAEP